MNDTDDFVRLYALIEGTRKKCVSEGWKKWKDWLKDMGYTESDFKDIEDKALAQLGGENLDTEYGKVVIESSDVYMHRNSKVISKNQTLKLITKAVA